MGVKHQCKKCDYEWLGRTSEPKQCPRCKRYDWNNNEKKEENK